MAAPRSSCYSGPRSGVSGVCVGGGSVSGRLPSGPDLVDHGPVPLTLSELCAYEGAHKPQGGGIVPGSLPRARKRPPVASWGPFKATA
jgi:hypothetical protein